jgi:hypothetical protein
MRPEFIHVNDENKKQGNDEVPTPEKEEIGCKNEFNYIHGGHHGDLNNCTPPRLKAAQDPDYHQDFKPSNDVRQCSGESFSQYP